MAKEKGDQQKRRIRKIVRILGRAYPDIHCPLKHSNPWELLVAVILSAQCTDKRVNEITPHLFKKYRTIKDYAHADPVIFSQEIHSAGFFRSKTKHILGAAKRVLKDFSGEVPPRMEDLIALPGVGRKTANVVLGNAFRVPGLPVDTHMIRLNRRLGFTRNTDPVKIERDLMEILPP